jgi:hypothetical protein
MGAGRSKVKSGPKPVEEPVNQKNAERLPLGPTRMPAFYFTDANKADKTEVLTSILASLVEVDSEKIHLMRFLKEELSEELLVFYILVNE